MNTESESKVVVLFLMILVVVTAPGYVQGTLAGNATAPSPGQDASQGIIYQYATNTTKVHSASVTVTLPQVTRPGDALIGAISLPTIGPIAPTVTGVLEGKAKWQLAKAEMNAARDEDVEIWYTLDLDTAKTVSVTFQLSNDFSIGTLAVVVEIKVVTTHALGGTDVAQGDCASTCAITSGTVKTTSPNELVVAFLGNNFMAASNSGEFNGSPTNGFKLLTTKDGVEFDYKIVPGSQKVTTSDTFVDGSPFDWCGVVAGFFR